MPNYCFDNASWEMFMLCYLKYLLPSSRGEQWLHQRSIHAHSRDGCFTEASVGGSHKQYNINYRTSSFYSQV